MTAGVFGGIPFYLQLLDQGATLQNNIIRLLLMQTGTPDTLAGHLEFALKWEGIELPLLKQLFKEAALK